MAGWNCQNCQATRDSAANAAAALARLEFYRAQQEASAAMRHAQAAGAEKAATIKRNVANFIGR